LVGVPAFILDPTIIYLVLIIGLWGAVTAAYMPGTGIIELMAIGANLAAVVLLTQMPTNWTALLILIVGALGFLLMPFLNIRLAYLAVGGLVLQFLGSIFLFGGGISVSLPIILLMLGVAFAYHQFALMPVLRTHHQQPLVGDEDTLLGTRGHVVKPLNPVGTVQAAGELWTARSERPLEAGEEVVIVERDGLSVIVEAVKHKRREET
jgi:membrane-bound serine protease (ClpP class)